MKKIFTLITMAVMAMTAMAEDYTGILRIGLGEEAPTDQEGTISVTESEGKYTLSLKDFSFMNIPVGNIVLSDLENTATDGTVALEGSSTVTIPLFPEDPLPVSLTATIDDTKRLSAKISITDVPGVETVNVEFIPPIVYTGTLTIKLGEAEMPQPATIEILAVNDVYSLTLKDFNFMGQLDFGDIRMGDMTNEATDGTISLSYDGPITLDGPMGEQFGEMPIKLQATTTDGAEVLNATITITVPDMGEIPVTFTSTGSTAGISSVETETGGDSEVVAIYDLQGRKVADTNRKGVYILRKADGTATKVYKK